MAFLLIQLKIIPQEAPQLEFRDNGPWLVANLPCADGSYRELQGINLDLHITNNDGELEWVPED
ncbi:uncharacterized protein EURHEDRAFT_382905 [Aspergillus ruber CBS 135680]|uniref:Cyanovirin-N domain-containing protein n=1 Tax=Aspergillus ruber (strain CBS 135680) TaxID=1388766 RepID=A0A017SU87_ASPRC|nr:uncharacterized protein EURHEDRAFT_382905 [Aspergillus ruber CBS 135680]EYE99870.1 hypothetical protein EURHEDRAFT_382905 [Aspergillus ruber CBS 135680]